LVVCIIYVNDARSNKYQIYTVALCVHIKFSMLNLVVQKVITSL
jgi:hypothetical protein